MNKCIYYQEVQDLAVGDSKTFTCGCVRHRDREIVVYVDEGWPGITTETVREVQLTTQSNNRKEGEDE